MLNKNQLLKIKEIKQRVSAMINERVRDGSASKSLSNVWDFASGKFRYMLGLEEEYFEDLRVHTYHLDGELYSNYSLDEYRERDRRAWLRSIDGIPERYQISSPSCAGEFGYMFDGKLVNSNIIRFQRAINVLFNAGILARLERERERRGGWCFLKSGLATAA